MAARDVTVSEAAASVHDTTTRFWRDRCGAVAVALAILLPVLIGFAGIGIEVGLWFAVQRQNQSAADAAAISAALEYAVLFEQPGMTTDPARAATAAAGFNLFSNANCSASGTTNCTLYPCYGFNVGSSSSCSTSNPNGTLPDAVQVVLTQPLNTAFANFVTAIWGPSVNTVNVTTTAIAALPMLQGGQTCLLAVGSGITFSTSATATVNLLKCSLASLSTSGNSIQLSGSANLAVNAAAVATAGNIVGSSAALPPYTFINFPLQDPYQSKNVTTMPLSGSIPAGPCNPQIYCGRLVTGSGTSITLPANYYIGSGGLNITAPSSGTVTVKLGGGITYIGSGGINITGCGNGCSGSVNVTFNPGLYYVDGGGFNIMGLTGSSNITGTGVTFVLTAPPGNPVGGINIDTNNACGATISLTGAGAGLLQPSATASQGLLFFQDPTAGPAPGNTITTAGCAASNVTLNGAIYTPASKGSLQGNVKGCAEFIAQSFTFGGDFGLDNTDCSASGITLNQAQIQQVYLAM